MANDPRKARAHRALRQEIVMGRLVRPDTCSKCGSKPLRAKDGRSQIQGHHHKGYDFPLDVEWLCVQCHRDETPCNPARGERAAPSKLTEDDVREIRTQRLTQKQCAAKFGVTTSAIRQILAGKTWKHVSIQPPALQPGSER